MKVPMLCGGLCVWAACPSLPTGPSVLDPWDQLTVTLDQGLGVASDAGVYCPQSWGIVLAASAPSAGSLPVDAGVELIVDWGWLSTDGDCDGGRSALDPVTLDSNGFGNAFWCFEQPPPGPATVTARSGSVSASASAAALQGCQAVPPTTDAGTLPPDAGTLLLNVDRAVDDVLPDGGPFCPSSWQIDLLLLAPATTQVQLAVDWGWLELDAGCDADAGRTAVVTPTFDGAGGAEVTWCFSQPPTAPVDVRAVSIGAGPGAALTVNPLAGCLPVFTAHDAGSPTAEPPDDGGSDGGDDGGN